MTSLDSSLETLGVRSSILQVPSTMGAAERNGVRVLCIEMKCCKYRTNKDGMEAVLHPRSLT